MFLIFERSLDGWKFGVVDGLPSVNAGFTESVCKYARFKPIFCVHIIKFD